MKPLYFFPNIFNLVVNSFQNIKYVFVRTDWQDMFQCGFEQLNNCTNNQTRYQLSYHTKQISRVSYLLTIFSMYSLCSMIEH